MEEDLRWNLPRVTVTWWSLVRMSGESTWPAFLSMKDITRQRQTVLAPYGKPFGLRPRQGYDPDGDRDHT